MANHSAAFFNYTFLSRNYPFNMSDASASGRCLVLTLSVYLPKTAAIGEAVPRFQCSRAIEKQTSAISQFQRYQRYQRVHGWERHGGRFKEADQCYQSIVTGRYELVILPTGGGKSLNINPSIFSLGPPLLTGAGRLHYSADNYDGGRASLCAQNVKCIGKSRIAERLATARWQNDQHVSPSHELSDSAGLLLSCPAVLKSLHWFTKSCIDHHLWKIRVEPRYKTISTSTSIRHVAGNYS